MGTFGSDLVPKAYHDSLAIFGLLCMVAAVVGGACPTGPSGKLLSASLPIKVGAFFAKRLPTIARPKILALDVVARVAFRIVVMDGLLGRMPRCFTRHRCYSLLTPPIFRVRVPNICRLAEI